MPEKSVVDKAILLDNTMDEKERVDRAEAAKAYAGEDPGHFVSYGEDLLAEATRSSEDQRKEWDELNKAYHRKRDYSQKEAWQSKVITDDPFTTVQRAKAIVRRGIIDNRNYFDVNAVDDKDKNAVMVSKMWKGLLDVSFSENQANFPSMMAHAVEMALAIGQSPEIIPLIGKRGKYDALEFTARPPWHIFRDPDGISSYPWSGMYWIHTELVDEWELRNLEKAGIYENISEAMVGGGPQTDEALRKERLGKDIFKRGRFRKVVRINEFWGIILDKQGNLLLPNSRFSFGVGTIIRKPEPNRFRYIRWPGVSFSPFPSAMSRESRGILNGSLSLWKLADNILNLHADDLSWFINRMFWMDPNMLLDGGEDSETYPGKTWLKKPNLGSSPPMGEIEMGRPQTSDVLAIMQYISQKWDNGTFVNPFVAGLPGTRSKITKGEVEIKTQQSLGMFDSIAKDIEDGATHIIRAVMDVMTLGFNSFDHPAIRKQFDVANDKLLTEALSNMGVMKQDARAQLLDVEATIKVGGISATLKEAEMLQVLHLLMQQSEREPWARYAKHYEMFKVGVKAMNLDDKDLVKTEEELKADAIAEQQRIALELAAKGGGGGKGGTLKDQALAAAGMDNGDQNPKPTAQPAVQK